MKGRKTGIPSDRLASASARDYQWAITDAASTESDDPIPPDDQDASNSSPGLPSSDNEEEEDQEITSWIASFHA
jgi:hypothetical protein